MSAFQSYHPLETDFWQRGCIFAGVDEAGRGAWAGPVFAAAVVLKREIIAEAPLFLTDSKLLKKKNREILETWIQENAVTWAVGEASCEEIDTLNIWKATQLAMHRALSALMIQPQHVLVDGLHRIAYPWTQTPIVDGDRLCASVAAASILAKVARDRCMTEQAKQFPEYGFENHVGYGTQKHQEALQRFGVTPIHRKSYAPIKRLLTQDKIRGPHDSRSANPQ